MITYWTLYSIIIYLSSLKPSIPKDYKVMSSFKIYWTLLSKNTNGTTFWEKTEDKLFIWFWRRFYLMIFRKWDRIFCSDTYVSKFGDTFSNTFIHKNYLRWEFKSGKSRIWRILSVLIVGSYKRDNSVLPYGTPDSLTT